MASDKPGRRVTGTVLLVAAGVLVVHVSMELRRLLPSAVGKEGLMGLLLGAAIGASLVGGIWLIRSAKRS